MQYSPTRFALAIALAVTMLASGAQATIVDSGSSPFIDPSPGVYYSGVKAYTVYTHDDAGNPAPGAPGELTYVYTITNNTGSSFPLIGFNIDVPIDSVVIAGSIDDGDLATPPPSFIVNNNDGVVNFQFPDPSKILPGQVTDQLYIISAFSPGMVGDTIYSINGDFSFDTTGTCVGPLNPPDETGEAVPCTIGFWKNRADLKQGTEQWFPNGDFDLVVTQALVECGAPDAPLFVNEADLLANLGSKGNRTIEERGKQQLAATCLNLAAGTLYPDNTKCKLFDGNTITTNACGDNLSVGAAVNQALIDIAGDIDAQHHAQECSDDINNGISVGD